MFADFRYAFRQLRKTPGLALVIILSLAFGIGAIATVACWLEAIVLRPIAGASDQAQLVGICSNQGAQGGLGNASLPDMRDFDAARDLFSHAAASQVSPALLTLGRQTEWTYGQIATANFFELLGVRPILGRTFLPDEDRKPGGDNVLVISERLWQRRFGGSPDVIGRVVELNRHPFTIVGVVPRGFFGTMTGLACEFWAPISMVEEVSQQDRGRLESRNARGFHTVARLAPGVSRERAQAGVVTLDTRLDAEHPATNRNVQHRVLPYSELPYGAQNVLGPALRLLFGVSVGLLVIVAANVANLQLSRITSRQTEIAVRVASGASRWRLARLLLAESSLLALLGGAAGLIVASWGVDALGAFVPTTTVPIALNYHLGGFAFSAAVAASVACGLLIAIIPCSQVLRGDPFRPLREAGRSAGASAGHHRTRSLLVVAELALAIVLLIGAGLCVKGFSRAREIDRGIQSHNVLVAPLQIGMSGYTVETGRTFYRELLQRISALPEVEKAGYSNWLPLGLEGCKGHGVDVAGHVRKPGENSTYEYSILSPGYLETVGIRLLAGRDFADSDGPAALPVAIVNQAFADQFWPGQNPLGRTFRCGGVNRTIVGLVPTAKYNRLNEPAHPFFYFPYTQFVPDLDLRLVIRTRSDPAAFIETVRRTVHEMDRTVELWGPAPLDRHLEGVLFPQRAATVLVLCLGAAALTLAAMGVYAVMAYAVSQRIPEFGIRLALGAQQRDLVLHVQKQGLRLAAGGVGAGLVGAVLVTRLLSSFLYGLSPFDPVTFGLVPLALTLVVLLACWIPARRAAGVDPMEALRVA